MKILTKIKFDTSFFFREFSAKRGESRFNLNFRRMMILRKKVKGKKHTLLDIKMKNFTKPVVYKSIFQKPPRGPRRVWDDKQKTPLLGVLKERKKIAPFSNFNFLKLNKHKFSVGVNRRFSRFIVRGAFKSVLKRRPKLRKVNAFNKIWQRIFFNKLAKKFLKRASLYTSRLKFIAKKYTKGVGHSQKNSVHEIQNKSIFAILLSLWPGLKAHFILALIKKGVCSVDNQTVVNPFLLIPRLSIIKFHLSSVSFIVFSMLFLKFRKSALTHKMSKKKISHFYPIGMFEINHKTNELLFLNADKNQITPSSFLDFKKNVDQIVVQKFFKKQKNLG